MSVLGSDMETHSASFWSFNHCFAFPPLFFHPCSRSLMISPLFSVLQNAVLSLITRATVLPGSLVTFVQLPSGAAAICTLFTSLILNLHCVVLCWCRVSCLAHIGHVKVNRPTYTRRWDIMNINVLDRRSSSSSSLPTVALAAIGQDYNRYDSFKTKKELEFVLHIFLKRDISIDTILLKITFNTVI